MYIGHKSLLSKIVMALLVGAIGFYALHIWQKSNKMPQGEYRLVDGSIMNTQSLQGKVIVFNFWSTTCASCIVEMPSLVKTYEYNKNRGLEVIAVASSYDDLRAVVEFTQAKKLPFKVAYDASGKAAQAWGGIKSTPITFVVNRKGYVVKKLVAEEITQLNGLLEDLL